MEKHSELYFTTGEFAKMLGVTKHTLFHYDKIGLLSPVIKEDNGYRYYFLWQMDAFEVIRALQKLGMPLKEIREYMQERSPKRFLSMMEDQEKQIDREIKRLKNMKEFIHQEKRSVEEASRVKLDTPHVVSCGKEYLLMTDVKGDAERNLGEEIGNHIKLREKYHMQISSVGTACSLEDLEQGRYDRYVKVYTRLEKKTGALPLYEKPAGDYLEVYYHGYDGTMQRAYRLIKEFADENGLNLEDLWYEDLLLDELTVKSYEEYLIKASVRVS